MAEREDALRDVDACQATIRELRYRLMQNQRCDAVISRCWKRVIVLSPPVALVGRPRS
jgi:hypothetical protein